MPNFPFIDIFIILKKFHNYFKSIAAGLKYLHNYKYKKLFLSDYDNNYKRLYDTYYYSYPPTPTSDENDDDDL